MDKDLKVLYSYALTPIFEKSIHKNFLTQKEYEENYVAITLVNVHSKRIENKLKELEKLKK